MMQRSSRIIIAVLLFSCLLHTANSITCEPFEGTPSQCSGVLNGALIAVPDGLTQAAVLQQSPVASYLDLLSTASVGCADSAVAFFCSELFPPCLNNTADEAAPVARRPCHSVCSNIFVACASEIESYGALLSAVLPDCDATDPNNGEPRYPDGDYTLNITGTSIVDACYVPEPANLSDSCNPGLVRYRDGSCFFKCPLILTRPHRMTIIKVTCSVMSVLSGIGWLITIASAVYRSGGKAFRWPRSIMVFLGINGLVLYLAMWMGMVSGFEAIWCVDGEPAGQSHASCAAQAVFFVFGFYGQAFWVFYLALNLAISFVIPNKIPPLVLEITAHCTAIGGPLISLIYGFARNEVGFPMDFQSCALQGRKALYTYVYPTIALIILTVLLIIFVVCFVIYRAISAGIGASHIKKQWRLLVMAAYTCFGVGMPTGIFFAQLQREDEIVEKVAAQLECLSRGQGDCYPDQLYPFSVILASYIAIMSVGILFAIITFDYKLLLWLRDKVTGRGTAASSSATAHSKVASYEMDVSKEY